MRSHLSPLRPVSLLLAALAATGCASMAAPGVSSAPTTRTAVAAALPTSVVWTQRSAEHRLIFEQVYANATRALDSLARGRTGEWAVVLDADETVIDNSEYQRRRALLDSAYTPESWSAWVAERAAPALPGAGAFLRRVHELGGRVVIVTNRTQQECADTRVNLESVRLPADLVLCRDAAPGGGDKNPRFAAIRNGTAAPGLPPLEVLIWVGDNITDFPELDQSARGAGPSVVALFGTRYFLLPNPMYGSWEG